MNQLREYAIALVVPVLILGFALTVMEGGIRLPGLRAGSLAPDFDLPIEAGPGASAGAHLKLADLRGKHVILDFWASWCGPCRRSMPIVSRVQAAYRDKLQVVGVHVDDLTPRQVARAARKIGCPGPTVTDRTGALQRAYGVSGLPTLVLINPAGKVVDVHVGVPEESDLRSFLNES